MFTVAKYKKTKIDFNESNGKKIWSRYHLILNMLKSLEELHCKIKEQFWGNLKGEEEFLSKQYYKFFFKLICRII